MTVSGSFSSINDRLAVTQEQLDKMAARHREVKVLLADARARERKLREVLEESQRALAEMTVLFTDYGIGALWVRTPYIPAENLAGYRWTAAQKPPLPVNPFPPE